ncbi:hypothetical protein C9426_14275 [Serratia sp. S1B]|nr:hypothetical protein C9426_14275 [Serratia sp. S1B]
MDDSEELLSIEEETAQFERLVLYRFIPQRTSTIKTKTDEFTKFDDGSVLKKDITIIEVLNRHDIDFIFLKSEFELNPYCLEEFWLSDIFYLCHEIRRNLHLNKVAEAQQDLEKVKYVYETFSKLSEILNSYSLSQFFYKIEHPNDLLFHLCLPKLYSYCYISNDPKQQNPEFERFLTRSLRNTISDGHRLEFLELLIETAKSEGKWNSKHSAVTQTKKAFSDNLKNNLLSNKQLIIKGRQTYIELFQDMQKRVRQALKLRPWLKSIKLSHECNSTAKTVLDTLNVLIAEQKNFLVRIKNQDFIFLERYEYSEDTLTNWIDSAPYQTKELILIDPGNPPSDH